MKITLEEAKEIINSIPTGQFFSATFEVQNSASSTIRKGQNPHWDAKAKRWMVNKMQTVSGRVGVRLANTNGYQAPEKARKAWSRRKGNLSVHVSKGTTYLPITLANNSGTVKTVYSSPEGKPVDLSPWKSPSKGEIKVLTPKLENLVAFRANKIQYEIVD